MKRSFPFFSALLWLLLLWVVSCKKTTDPAPVTPGGTTNPGSTTGTTTALAISTITPLMAAEGQKVILTGAGFSATAANNLIKFGTVSAVTDSATTTRLVTKVPKGAVSGVISLTVGTLAATSTNSFTVSTTPASMTTLMPVVLSDVGGSTLDVIGINTATFTGDIQKNNGSPVTQYGHVWSETNQTPTVADSKTELGKSDGPFPLVFTSSVKDIKASTTYYYRAYATNANGTGYSGVVTIKTKAAPTVADALKLDKLDNIASNGITCYGTFGYNKIPGLGSPQLYSSETIYMILSDSQKEPVMGDKTNFLDEEMSSERTSISADNYYTFAARKIDFSRESSFFSDPHMYTAGKTYYARLYVKKKDGTALYSNVVTFQPKAVSNAPTVYTGLKTFTVNDILYAYNSGNLWRYNLQSNTWLAPDPAFKFGSNDGDIRDNLQDDVQANGSKIYAVTDETNFVLSPTGFSIYEYDFSTKTSKKLSTNSEDGTLTAPGGGGQNFVLKDQKLYIRSYNRTDKKSYLWVYDLVANTLTKSGEITGGTDSDLTGTFFQAHDNILAVYNPKTSQKYTYDLATKKWSAASSVNFYNTLDKATKGGAYAYVQRATATGLYILTHTGTSNVGLPGAAMGKYTVSANSLSTIAISADDMQSTLCSYGDKAIYLETNNADGTYKPRILN